MQLSPGQAQIDWLQDAGRLNEEGLAELLQAAANLTRSEPAKARQLTHLCAHIAQQTDLPMILPHAAYIQAQTYAINGEFDTSLRLIQEAHEGYAALKQSLQALRTNVGKMHVLNELGRHQEVLEVGQTIFAQLEQPDPAFQSDEARLITMLAYNNLGVCYRRMGQYEEALQAYDQAEAAGLAANLIERLGDVRHNRGLILMHLGRVREALEAFQSAAALFAEANLKLLHAQALINTGEAYLLLGHYTHSLEALSQAGSLLKPLNSPANERLVILHRADVYLALNLFPEALAAYREADALFQKAGMSYYRARSLWGMGAALSAEGELGPAEQALAEAATLFEAAGNIPRLCSVMLEQAALLASRGEPALGIALADQALSLITEEGTAAGKWPVEEMYVHLRLADLLLPDSPEAEAHLDEVHRLSKSLALPHLRYRLYQRLGQLRRRQGRRDDARRFLEKAISDVEQLRGSVSQEAMRASFVTDKMVAYEELLQLHLDDSQEQEGDIALLQAFATAEQAKSRVLVDMLTGVLEAREPAGDAAVESQIETLQADLNAIYNEFLGLTERQTTPAKQRHLQERAHELEQTISQLWLEVNGARRKQDPFLTPLPYQDIRQALPPDLTLIAYHIIGDEIMAFVSRGESIKAAPRLSRASQVQQLLQRLNVQWDRFRAGQTFARRHMSLLLQSTERILGQLYDELIRPLLPFLPDPQSGNGAQRLAIIPHGLLHQAPFHALHDGQNYLLDYFEISYAPSATVLTLCQQRQPRQSGRGLIMGVPDPLIPAVAEETRAIQERLPESRLYFGQEATLETLKREAADCDILHLACHGLFRADNPIFSAVKLENGWLTAADAHRLDLAGALVTLSACESGRSQVMAGDEVIGLPRALLGAGAAALVVSLWLVQDETTVSLMADWYDKLQEGRWGWAGALRQAQLTLRDSFPHPYYWAPFILIGRWQ